MTRLSGPARTGQLILTGPLSKFKFLGPIYRIMKFFGPIYRVAKFFGPIYRVAKCFGLIYRVEKYFGPIYRVAKFFRGFQKSGPARGGHLKMSAP